MSGRNGRGLPWQLLALSLTSVLVFLGAAELVVRALGPDLTIPQAESHFRFEQGAELAMLHHQRDPVLGWRLLPGIHPGMRVNSQGFRGPELPPERDPRRRRIALLGDSCTMGFRVASEDDIFAGLLPRLLAGDGIAAETLNFGVDGYSSHQGRLLLDDVLDVYAPDYVTLYFGYNDHHWANASDREIDFSTPAARHILETSHAYRLLRRWILRLAGKEARLVTPERRVAPDAFEENLRAMVLRIRGAGAVPILLTTPLRPGVPLIQNEVRAQVDGHEEWVTQSWWVRHELARQGLTVASAAGSDALLDVLTAGIARHPDWPYLHWLQARELHERGDEAGAAAARRRARELDAERRVMDDYNRRVRTVARELDAPLLDLAETFASEEPKPLFIDVVHPNRAGHRLIAARLEDLVVGLEAAR